MCKDDELVWVFPDCMMNGFYGLPGVSARAVDWSYFSHKVLETCRFMRRGDVEDEPSLQQIIPYVLVRCEDKILVYNRGTKGGEKRLADKWSIGIGGHINPVDKVEEDTDPFMVLMRAMSREVQEELELPNINSDKFYFVGLLKSEDSSVDRVHFGVVFETTLASTTIGESKEIDRYKWVNPSQLKGYKLERWSELVVENVL